MYVIEILYLDLDQIYKSGQVFRWIKLKDGKYIVINKDKIVKVEQKKTRFIFDCSEEDFYNVWWKYFDLQTDYSIPNYAIGSIGKEEKIAATRGKGIHILNQDLFEIIISCSLETATSVQRVSQMVNGIAKKCGIKHKNAMREAGQVIWYEFPTVDQIIEKQDSLTTQETGYKYDTIIDLCKSIRDGWLDLDVLKTLDYYAAKSYLTDFNGIGPKVADSICLYGLHHMQAFPVDTHMMKVLKSMDLDFEDYYSWFIEGNETIRNNAGLLRQYLWYNEVNPPRRIGNVKN